MNLTRPGRTLLACCVLSTVLGSIHAFSIFLDPLESTLDASRGTVSAVYSVALVALTLMVLLAHPLYSRISPPVVAVGVGAGAAVGLAVTAGADSVAMAMVGYGVLFGAANGVGYGYALQIGAEANPHRRGFAMGLVTAVYAVGAAGGAGVLGPLIDGPDAGSAVLAQAGVIMAAAVVAAVLLTGARPAAPSVPHDSADADAPAPPSILLLWLAYTTAVLAGLMALGHAAEIIGWAGGRDELKTVGVVLAGIGNAVGGIAVAFVADRVRVRPLLVALPVASAAALVVLAASPAGVAVAALVLVALVYGAVIAVYPFAVSFYFGQARYPSVYGRVFIGWGLAGFIGPIGAGLVFDARGDYGLALVLAVAAALLSSGAARRLPVG